MKSPKENYKIRKSVVLDSGPREDPLIFLPFYTLNIFHVFTSIDEIKFGDGMNQTSVE